MRLPWHEVLLLPAACGLRCRVPEKNGGCVLLVGGFQGCFVLLLLWLGAPQGSEGRGGGPGMVAAVLVRPACLLVMAGGAVAAVTCKDVPRLR